MNFSKKHVLITSLICALMLITISFTSEIERQESPIALKGTVKDRDENDLSAKGDKSKDADFSGSHNPNKDKSGDQGHGSAGQEGKDESSNQPASTTSQGQDQKYKDGDYTGKAQGFKGDISVKVQVSSGKISDIQILESNDDEEYFNSAKSLIGDIISSQETSVEAVSGATYSSNGIINAVKNALESGAII